MFGGKAFPKIEVTEGSITSIANRLIRQGTAVPGVQKKLSLGLFAKRGVKRLTITDYTAGYILKPQTFNPDYPESENLVMIMANHAKIKTVPHGLVELKDGTLAYLAKRIDRDGAKEYPMEDFCQLSGRLTESKYDSSYENCKKVIAEYSSVAVYDETELFVRLVFSFLTCNSDMH